MSLHRLSDRQIKHFKEEGDHNDGGGLYLRVRGVALKKSFQFRTKVKGKTVKMSLGRYPDITLASAREKAGELRIKVREPDVIAAIQSGRSLSDALTPALVPDDDRVPTFWEYAQVYIPRRTAGHRNQKAVAQWYSTIRTYCASILSKRIDEVDQADVVACLDPIWTVKPETAKRVQQRMHRILAGATVEGHRSGQNPAQWQGYLDEILPNTRHLKMPHPALAYKHLPEFYTLLREREGVSSYALRLIILTACRVNEVLAGRWSEIDLNRRVWTIPADRMKMKKDHEVPLTDEALSILKELKLYSGSDLIFAEPNKNGFLTDAAVLKVGKKVNALLTEDKYTTHGLRSTFRDAVGDLSDFARELAEEQLSHEYGSTEAAYRRGRALERRREMMDWYTQYCLGAHSSVIRLQA